MIIYSGLSILSSTWELQGEGGGSWSSYQALSILRIITGPLAGPR